VTEIGFVMTGRGVALLGADGKPVAVKEKGWRHF
jgi:thiamine monophosphate kinase